MSENQSVEPVRDRLLLLAYVAVESESLSMALDALYQAELIASTHRDRAMLQADAASWSFCLELGEGVDDEPEDRLSRAQAYLDSHVEQLAKIRNWR